MPSTQTDIDGITVFEDSCNLPDTAPAIVMVHGWPDTHRVWDGQVAALRDQFRCVRFTLPGFDTSKPPRPTSLADMLVLFERIAAHAGRGRPVTLLLHDWGCFFGYQFALSRPDRVAGVIGVDIGDVASVDFRRSLSTQAKLMAAGYQLWLALAWKLGGQLGDRMTRWMARALRCPAEPARIGAQMNYPYAMRWFGALGGFKAMRPLQTSAWPMLFIYGQRKPFMFHSPAWSAALAARPGCAVMGLRAGHWVMHNQPEAFNQALRDWLAGIAVAGSEQP